MQGLFPHSGGCVRFLFANSRFSILLRMLTRLVRNRAHGAQDYDQSWVCGSSHHLVSLSFSLLHFFICIYKTIRVRRQQKAKSLQNLPLQSASTSISRCTRTCFTRLHKLFGCLHSDLCTLTFCLF